MSTEAPAKPSSTPAKTSSGYDVARPHGICSISGKPILPDAKFMAALRETAVAFERLDISLDCWDNFDRQNVIAFWKTTMPHAEAKKKLFVDDEVLANLFERLADTTEPAKLNFRFVLGLILMRKRILIYDNTLRDESVNPSREIWIVRLKGRDAQLEMLNPHLTEEQVQDVSKQLGEILNEEL